jgi:hypothetical protein
MLSTINSQSAFQCFQACNQPTALRAQPLNATSGPAGIKQRDLIDAGLLFMLGMLTHQLPVRARPGKSLLPADWKAFFRIGTGIVAVNRLNSGLNWQPPPWLGALEAVTVINPLALGFSGKSLRQYAVMAPLVAATVQVASTLNNRLAKPLHDQFNMPRLITRLAISLGFAGMGIKLYPKVFHAVAKTGLLGQEMKQQAAKGLSVLAGSSFITCARGCSPGSIICLSETAELMGGLTHWLKTQFRGTPNPTPNADQATSRPDATA